ncbi:hypothetical protein GF314_06075 [bacterium]|nr:hypothetical protein [bacterium]
MPSRLISIVALLVVSGFWFLVAVHYRDGDEPSFAGTLDASRPRLIDPAPFRRDIETAEALIYAAEPPDWSTAERAGAAITDVGSVVVGAVQDPHLRKSAESIIWLGQRVAAAGDVGYALPDLVEIRHEWEALRNEVFQPVAWFRGNPPTAAGEGEAAGAEVAARRASAQATTAALDEAQTPAAPAPITRFERRQYERMVDALARLSERGRRKCAALGEPDYDISVPTPRSEKHVARWFAWSREWENGLFDAWKEAPHAPGFQEQQDLQLAYQDLEKALRQLQLVPRGAGMWPTPFEHQWEQRFDLAESHLASATEHLASVRTE